MRLKFKNPFVKNLYYDVLKEFTLLLIQNRSLRCEKKFMSDVNENWITKTGDGWHGSTIRHLYTQNITDSIEISFFM